MSFGPLLAPLCTTENCPLTSLRSEVGVDQQVLGKDRGTLEKGQRAGGGHPREDHLAPENLGGCPLRRSLWVGGAGCSCSGWGFPHLSWPRTGVKSQHQLGVKSPFLPWRYRRLEGHLLQPGVQSRTSSLHTDPPQLGKKETNTGTGVDSFPADHRLWFPFWP